MKKLTELVGLEEDVAVMEKLGLVRTFVDDHGVTRITLTPRGVKYVERMRARGQKKPR